MNDLKCKICTCAITKGSKSGLCRSCAEKAKIHLESCQCMLCRDKTGKNNPNFGNHKLAGKNNPNFGKTGILCSRYKHGKTLIPNYCIDCNKEINYRSVRCHSCAEKGILNDRFGIKEPTEVKNKRIQKIIKASNCCPNKAEKYLFTLLKKWTYDTYKFVGDGTIILDGFNPDFIDEKNKKIIELYGRYWHNRPGYKERDNRRLITYTKLGYKILIIWDNELKNLDSLQTKIQLF